MKAITSALSRLIGNRLSIIITVILLTISVTGAGLLLFSYYQLNQSFNNNLAPASQLLPQLVDLRNNVAQLHVETVGVLFGDVPDRVRLTTLRASLDDIILVVKSYTADKPDYKALFNNLNSLTTIYDSQMAIAQNNPTALQLTTARFELERAFQVVEDNLAVIHQKEQENYYEVTNQSLQSVGNLQLTLFGIGAIIAVLGGTLIFFIRSSSRREALLASGRLQVAAEIGQAAASVLSLEQLYDTTLNLIVQRFRFYYACVFLIDENGEYAVLRAATGESGSNLIATGHKVLVGSNSTIGQVTFTGRSIIFSESRRQTEYFKNELIAATRSELAVPLRQGGQVIGALDFQSLDSDPFTTEDVTVLQTLADQIAVAIGNAAQFTREQVRARQMSTLSQASIRLTGPQLSLTSLLETIVNETRSLLASDDISVWLPADDGELELKASVAQTDQLGRRLKRGEGISGQAFESNTPLRIDDYPRWTGRSRQQASAGIQSAMAVPLLWQAEAVGALTLTRNQVNRPFTTDDQQITQLYASQVASAIENNRLLQETQDRVNELFTLNQIGQAIAAQTDLNSLFDILRQEIIRALNTKSFYVAFYDAETKMVDLPYMYESGAVQTIPPFPLGPGFTSHIIQTRQPLKIDSAEESKSFNPLQSGAAAESYLGVPLLQRNQVLGVIAVQDTDTPKAYSEADARLLTTIAGQVSLSVQNIRLLEQSRRRAEELTSLNRITNAIISVKKLDELLTNAAREIVAVFKTRNCGIALIDANGLTATVMAEANRDPNDPSARGVVIPMEGNLSSQRVIETGRAVIIQNAQTDPLTASIQDLMIERRTTALMIVPLLVRGKVIGTVGIDSDEPNRVFLPAEQELAETLIAQVATAIDNNQLLEETRRRAEQLAAAAQISRAAISILDPDELIVRSANLIRERFDLYYVAIFLADDENLWANLRYATGEAGQKLLAINHRLGIGSQSMVGTAIASQTARIALDVGQEAVRFSNPYLPDTHSEMALPLVVAGRAIGALDVQSTRYSAFNQDDITVLQTLADQVAVALENGRLFARQKRATELELLISTVSAKITKSPVIQSIVENAATELGRTLGAGKVVVKLRPVSQRRLPGSQGHETDSLELN